MLIALSHFTVISPDRVVDLFLAPFAVLGTTSTFGSGLLGALALIRHRPRSEMSDDVSYGFSVGFLIGAPLALAAFIAGLSSSHGG